MKITINIDLTLGQLKRAVTLYEANPKPKKSDGIALVEALVNADLLDIPSPIKNMIPEYHVVENRMMAVIARKFGFSWPLRDEVKKADRMQLRIEWEAFMIAGGGDGYTQAKAETEFLKRFKEVTK